MNVVIAMDSFKGSLSSVQAGEAVRRAVRAVDAAGQVTVLAVGDGGEGTVAALLAAGGGDLRRVRVSGPLGPSVTAEFAVIPVAGDAVLEMASASGLTLIPAASRNPERTSTYGTGELIRAALAAGCEQVTVAVGGSATVDGGAGALQALGVQLRAADGSLIPAPVVGGDLHSIAALDLGGLGSQVTAARFTFLCDVNNPLVGPNGAARVFGLQKGATPDQVQRLSEGLEHWATVLERATGVDVRLVPGAAAAGGLPAGFAAVLGASLVPGAQAVLDRIGFDRHLHGADLVITGEGRIDGQSMMGKVVGTVARRARNAGVPVIAIGGCQGQGAQDCLAVCDAMFVVAKECPDPLPDVRQAEKLLEECAERSLRVWRASRD
jgi:glycerate kinase